MYLVAAACLGVGRPVWAGLYIPLEQPELTVAAGKARALPFDAFRLSLQNVRGIVIPKPESDLRQHYFAKRSELLAKRKGIATAEELVSLSGYLIRLGELDVALEVLREAERKDVRNFTIQSNQALVAHLQASPDAVSMQLAALQMLRRSQVPGWTNEQHDWYLRAEQALYDLERARLTERRNSGARSIPDSVDNLFKVSFVGESGQYEAGVIAAPEKSKLPDDAIVLVQQLLFWLPNDSRLIWLLAELYNAQGDLTSAAALFDDCIDSRRFETEQLKEHRRIVKEALARQRLEPSAPTNNWQNHPEAFWIIGGVLAVPLVLLIYWQCREIFRRVAGKCPAKH
jgi:hypothetical protein